MWVLVWVYVWFDVGFGGFDVVKGCVFWWLVSCFGWWFLGFGMRVVVIWLWCGVLVVCLWCACGTELAELYLLAVGQ